MFNPFKTNVPSVGIAVNDHVCVIAFLLFHKVKLTVEKTVCNDFENLAYELNQIKKQKYHAVVFSINDSKSISKKIIIDTEIKEKNIQRYLIDNQIQFFPGIKEELSFDYEIIASNQQQYFIQVNAIKKTQYQQIMTYCVENKIKPMSIEFYSDSLIRLINSKLESNKVRLFIGYNYFIVFQKNKIIFSERMRDDLSYLMSSFLLQHSDYQIEAVVVQDSMEDEAIKSLSKQLLLPMEKLSFDNQDWFEVIASGAALWGNSHG